MSLLRTESIPRRGRVKPAAKETKPRPALPAHNLLQLERDAIHRVETARRKREAEELAGETVSGLDLRDVTRFLTDEKALTPANIVGLHTAQQLAQLRKDLAERGQKDSRREAEPDKLLEEVAGEPDDSLVEAPQPVKAIPEDLRLKRHQFLSRFKTAERKFEWKNPFATYPDDNLKSVVEVAKPVDLATIATPLMNATAPIDQGANDEIEMALEESIKENFLNTLTPERFSKAADDSFYKTPTAGYALPPDEYADNEPTQIIEPNVYSPTAPKSLSERATDFLERTSELASGAFSSLLAAAGRVDNLNPIKKMGEIFKDSHMDTIHEDDVEVETRPKSGAAHSATFPAPPKRDAPEETIDETIKDSLDIDGRPSQEETAEAAEQDGQPAPAVPETDLNGDQDSAAGDEGESRALSKADKAAANKHERETRARLKGSFGGHDKLANYVQFKENAPGGIRQKILETLQQNPMILVNLYRVGASTPLSRETAEFWKNYGTRFLVKSPDIAKDPKKSLAASWDKFRTEYPDWEKQFGKGLDFEHRREHQDHQHEQKSCAVNSATFHRHEHQEHETERYFPEREIQRVIDLRDRGQIDSARVYAMSLRGLLSPVQLNYLLCYITGC